MSDLTEFLLARIAEDEAVARAASDGPWTYEPGGNDDGAVLRAEPHPESVRTLDSGYDLSSRFVAMTSYDDQSSTTYNSDNDGEHIARHNPSRVLAESEAKRRIIRQAEFFLSGYEMDPIGVEEILENLASVYADHLDYREEWRP